MGEINGCITKLKINGFKKFQEYEISFKKGVNILIGENEAGKSSILDAINVVLNQKYGNFDKYIIEELINKDNLNKFLSTKKYEDLPKISIEIFLDLENIPQNEIFYGVYHSDNPSLKSEKENFKYGIIFECCFDDEYKNEMITTIQEGKIPFDFYKLTWNTFSNTPYKIQKKALKILNIDNSNSNSISAYDYYNKNLYLNKYSSKTIFEHKGKFREKLKESFDSLNLENISENKKFGLNSKKLIIENILTIFENDIPIENMGKGKENVIKTETALDKDANRSDIVLIEEPECHLSHLNLRKMINMINNSTNNKQIIITTHNNLIVTQSDISKLIIIGKEKPKLIDNISDETKFFFEKSDDYNLLQFLLADKCILVEGRTEYQLINNYYSQLTNTNNTKPENDKIDIISCYGKTYKNYLDIAKGLGKQVCVITDNDSNEDFISNIKLFNETNNHLKIFTDENKENWTFEVCLYNLNKELLSSLIKTANDAEYKFNGVSYKDNPVLGYMLNNKAKVAYILCNMEDQESKLNFPQYIKDAIRWIKS